MKNPKHSNWTLGLLMSVFVGSGFLAACGKSGGDSGGSNYTPGIVQSCAGGVCSYPVTANSTLGFYAQTSNFYVPGYINAGSALQVNGGMGTVLRDAMGVCDRGANVGGYSGGYAGCSTWQGGAHDMVLYSNAGATASNMKLVIRSVPGNLSNSGSWYSYDAPSFKNILLNLVGFPVGYNSAGVFDPMVLNATIWPVNNNQGFEVRAYGPTGSYAYNKLFQLQVANGKLEDAQWNFVLYFNGQQAMSGTSVRCQSQTCGLDGTYFNAGY